MIRFERDKNSKTMKLREKRKIVFFSIEILNYETNIIYIKQKRTLIKTKTKKSNREKKYVGLVETQE